MTISDDELDDIFDAARGAGDDMPVSDALMARIIADAAAEMPRPVAMAPKRSLGTALFAALGGWTAISGLAAATVAGVWLGVSPPAALDTFLTGESLSVALDTDLFTNGTEG